MTTKKQWVRDAMVRLSAGAMAVPTVTEKCIISAVEDLRNVAEAIWDECEKAYPERKSPRSSWPL